MSCDRPLSVDEENLVSLKVLFEFFNVKFPHLLPIYKDSMFNSAIFDPKEVFYEASKKKILELLEPYKQPRGTTAEHPSGDWGGHPWMTYNPTPTSDRVVLFQDWYREYLERTYIPENDPENDPEGDPEDDSEYGWRLGCPPGCKCSTRRG